MQYFSITIDFYVILHKILSLISSIYIICFLDFSLVVLLWYNCHTFITIVLTQNKTPMKTTKTRIKWLSNWLYNY